MKDERILKLEQQWSALKGKYGMDAFLHIPIPVIYSRASADAESIADELSRFVYEEKLLKKTNVRHEDYLIFTPSYKAHSDQTFSVVQDLYYHMRNAGGYYGSYRGILLADVSEWSGHYKDKYFDIFLSYLADQRGNGIIPFFYAECLDSGADRRALEAIISSYFSIIPVSFDVAKLCGYAVAMMKDEGILLDDGAGSNFEGFIRECYRSELFHGTESIRHICKDVARRYRQRHERKVMDEVALKGIISDLGYEDMYKDSSVKVIGFR